MTDINGLTNPFENAVLSSNENQLTKQKRIDDYCQAVAGGYEPPIEILDAIATILAQDVLSPEDEVELQALLDKILGDIAPEITSNGGEETASINFVENSLAPVTTVTATDEYASNDAAGGLTYSIIGGADSGLFQIDPNTGVLTFIAPPDFEAAAGDLEVIVQVSDGSILVDTQTVTVAVTDANDVAPEISSNGSGATAAVMIDENTTVVTTVASVDPDTVGTATYSIAGGADALFFNIDATTGELSFIAAPDFEAPGDVGGDNVYDVTVQVSDGSQTDTQAIAVTVNDVSEAPPFPATFGFVLNGINSGDFSGGSVSSAGDVNGDGIDDVLIGAWGADPNSVDWAGETYVVFGKNTAVDGAFSDSINLASLDGSNGFVLNGINTRDYSGMSVSSAGDVNGDGIDDILVGAWEGDPSGVFSAGETYVVFGKDTAVDGAFAASFDLANLDGSNGFVLNGIGIGDYSGRSVSSAGDVNGDGVDDILIGAFNTDPNGLANAGATYVVFGKDTAVGGAFSASIDLETLDGSNGFVLNGIDANDWSGLSVSSAGDVNGDGIADILIGADHADPDGAYDAGETYVVFGKNTAVDGAFSDSINLASLDGSNGFVLNGIDNYDASGNSVSSAGDVNGDGIDDILIGADAGDPNGFNSGETYIVFGKDTAVDGAFSASIDLETLDGSNGFVLNGINTSDYSGKSVSSAGDVNGDGVDDILISARGEVDFGNFPAPSSSSGDVYLVFGKDTAVDGAFAASIDLETLGGSDGFVFKEGPGDNLSVSSAGDVNGDGINDILIGADAGDPNGFNSGETYVVFGGADLLAAYDTADGVTDGSISLNLISEDPMMFV